MANRHKMHKKKLADGGKVNEYNAVGSPEVKEAKDTSDTFKKGGRTKSAGKMDGEKAASRLDKKPRRKLASGGSTFSAARKMSEYTNGGSGAGHQGDGPSGEDKESK